MFSYYSSLLGRGLTACAMLALAFGAAGTASAQDFSGKTVRVIVGYAPGGAYDIYARQVARYIGDHLPGKPNVVAQNMAGAGSIRAANYLYVQAPKDGTEFGTFARNLPLLAFSGGSGSDAVRFDPLKFTWVGTPSSYGNDAYLMAVRSDIGVTSASDLRVRKEPLRFASTGFGSTGHDIPLVLRETLGLNITVVHGYPGGNQLYLAVDRGEMDGRMVGLSSIRSAQPNWLTDGSINILLQFARETRHESLPNVPTARELARSEADLALIEMMEAPYFLARPFAGPPDIPEPIAKTLRAGFMATQKDPNYLKDAERLGIDISPMDGERMLRVVERMSKIPRDLYARYSDILAKPKSEPRQVKWEIVDGRISKLAKKGRFEFESSGKTMKSRVTDGYTKLTVGGKEARGSDIKEGMACKVWFEGDGTDAGQMECK